jgi:hypothetical protein
MNYWLIPGIDSSKNKSFNKNIDRIRRFTCKHLNISINLIMTKTRDKEVVKGRQIIIHLAINDEYIKPILLAKYFKMNHANISYSNKTVFNLMETDKDFLSDVETIREMIKNIYRHGINNAAAKLNEAKVLSIREKYKTGLYSHKQLGEQYGVGPSTISYVISKKLWSHIK